MRTYEYITDISNYNYTFYVIMDDLQKEIDKVDDPYMFKAGQRVYLKGVDFRFNVWIQDINTGVQKVIDRDIFMFAFKEVSNDA